MGTDILPVKRRKPQDGFMTLLSSAACEWFLIFLLFLDAVLSYLLVKFAHYCDLKEPCPLCSRFDNIFPRNKPRSFYTLLCNNHKEEISSSVPCSVHGNFADINTLCEECLVPSAMERKSSSESYRLLAGKLRVDVEQSVFQHLVMNKYIHLGSSIRKTCLCCNKTWRTKSNAERLLEFTPVALGASKANVKPPLPRVPGRSRFSRRDSLKRLREKFAGPVKPVESSGSSTLAHVGYTKLKLASDSESEFPFSEDDDDDANTVCSFRSAKSAKTVSNGERDIQFGNRGVQKSPMVNNTVLGKKTSQGLEAKHASVEPNLLDLSYKSDSSSKSDIFVKHGLRELNWAEYYKKPVKSSTPELISLAGSHHPSDADGGENIGSSVEESTPSVSLPDMSALSVLSELLSIGPSFSNAAMVPTMTNNNELINGNGDAETAKHTEDACSADTSLSKQHNKNSVDSSESLRLSNNNDTEHINIVDSAKIGDEEEVKSLPQVSPIGVSVPSKDDHFKSTNIDDIEHINVDDSVKTGEEEEAKSLPQVSATGVSVPAKDGHSKLKSVDDTEHIKVDDSAKIGEEDEIKSLPQVSPIGVYVPSKDNHFKSTNIDIEHINVDDSAKTAEEEEAKSLPQVSHVGVSVPAKNDHSKFTKVDDIEHINVDDSARIGEEEKAKSLPQVSPIDVSVPAKGDHFELTDNDDIEHVSVDDSAKISNQEETKSLPQVSHIDVSLPSKDDHSKLTNSDDIDHINVDDSAKIGEEEQAKSPQQVSPIDVSVPSKVDHSVLTVRKKEEQRTREVEEVSKKDNDSIAEVVRVTRSLTRNFSLESLDGINVGDIEGESVVDRLKRQMISLYKELEEERNAAAIAANEAMAMITRLQEEKAALHMEALQYLRMMEEQAEYDMEALEKSNDLLAEKEKELQDLEAELEFYRNNLLDESGEPDLPKDYSNAKNNSAAFSHNMSGTFGNSKANEISIGNGNGVPMNSTIRNFHEEKSHMLQHLRFLEEKLRQSYCIEKSESINSEIKDQGNGEQVHEFISSSNGKTELNSSSAHDEEQLSESRSETSSVILEEIAEIHGRLEALETI